MRQGIGECYQLTGNKVVFKPAVSINTMHDVLVCYTCVKKVIGEEWQAKIQEHKKQSIMKAKKFGLLYAILMLTLTVSAQTGSISKIWLEHGVTENNSTGLRVHITVHTTGMKGIPARAIAYFDSPQGTGIKDLNGAYCTSSGTVCASKDFTPSYTQCTYENMGIFIPYEELHMSPGKRTYYCRVFLQNLNNNKFLCNSNFVSFTGTGASNQQAQQYPNNTPQGSFPNGKTLYLANAKKTNVVSAKFYYDNENDAICFLTHPYKPLYQGPGDTFILENRDSQGLHFREFKTEPLTTMVQVSPFGPPTPMYMGKVGKVKKNKTFVLSPNHTCITFLGVDFNVPVSEQEYHSIFLQQTGGGGGGSYVPNTGWGGSNGGTGNGGGSSYQSSTCKYCHGTGRCSSCNGKGYKFNPYSGEEDQCPSCFGNGRCFNCHGSGRQR